MTVFAHDSALWRRLAAWGSQSGPPWFVRYSPPLIGAAASLVMPAARKAVRDNLQRVRGPVPPVQETLEIVSTFANYAGQLAESLAAGSPNDAPPEAVVLGSRNLEKALAAKRGIVFATAHTGGWEVVGALLRREYGPKVIIVMEPERDPHARAIQDRARAASGVQVAHVGDGPFDALPLLRHLREGGVIGIQIDRAPAGMRRRSVSFLGASADMPEGPFRLAQLTGAPIIPLFCARRGYRRYHVEASAAVYVSRRADGREFDAKAQQVADAFARFLRAHPTQWFHFQRPGDDADAPSPTHMKNPGVDAGLVRESEPAVRG